MSGDTRTARGEEGQVYLVLLTFIVFLVAGAGVVASYAGKDEVSSQARTAADAAALAGADIAADGILQQLLNPEPDFDLTCNIGRQSASSYAQTNGATLTSYCFDILTGTASAEVSIDKPVSDGTKIQRASARLRALPACKEKPKEPSDKGDDKGGKDGDKDKGDKDEDDKPSITCSLLGSDFEPGKDLDLNALKELLKPRLVPTT